jgi:RNA polymerase-binding transcription factor DksA
VSSTPSSPRRGVQRRRRARPEGATIAFERQQVAALLVAARQRLADVDAALARRAEGGYGTCADCGRPIAPERLAARPAARTCIDCAR